MKKFFIAMLAVAAVTACAKDEAISLNQEAIDFGNPFVENSTRATEAVEATDPSYGAVTFNKFQVWGTANGVAIYAGEDVTGTVGSNIVDVKETNLWTCTKKNYWIKDVKYNFAGVANGTVATLGDDKLPATISYTANGTSDLIYAKSAEMIGLPAGSNVPVELTFNHLLSKVKFTATTNTNIAGYSYTISDITINNAYDSGVYTVNGGTWGTLVKTNGQSFGNITVDKDAQSSECAQEKLLIPIAIADKVTISCTITLNFNGEKIWEQAYTGDNAIVVNTALAAANAYNFTIACNVGEEIKFSVVENAGWTTNTDTPIIQ